jgi:DNA-directed RNA polymerase specialized sigma24 family protein
MAQRDAAEHDVRPVPSGECADRNSIYEDNAAWNNRTIFARVGNRRDAEDLTSEAFLTAPWPLHFSASVPDVRVDLRFAARTVLAAHRRAASECEVTAIEDIGERAPDTEATVSCAPRRVQAMRGVVPYQYRQILELPFLQDCSLMDYATELGVSVTNATVLRHRAKRSAAQIDDEDER